MDIETLISQYIDGELNSDAEAELHHILAVSPEARALFRSHLALKGVARDARVQVAPASEVRVRLFDRLQAEGFTPSAVPASIGGVSAPAASIPHSIPSRRVEGEAPRRRRRAVIWALVPLLLLMLFIGRELLLDEEQHDGSPIANSIASTGGARPGDLTTQAVPPPSLTDATPSPSPTEDATAPNDGEQRESSSTVTADESTSDNGHGIAADDVRSVPEARRENLAADRSLGDRTDRSQAAVRDNVSTTSTSTPRVLRREAASDLDGTGADADRSIASGTADSQKLARHHGPAVENIAAAPIVSDPALVPHVMSAAPERSFAAAEEREQTSNGEAALSPMGNARGSLATRFGAPDSNGGGGLVTSQAPATTTASGGSAARPESVALGSTRSIRADQPRSAKSIGAAYKTAQAEPKVDKQSTRVRDAKEKSQAADAVQKPVDSTSNPSLMIRAAAAAFEHSVRTLRAR